VAVSDQVYGGAIKELIHEQFGDGIMSAINFGVDMQKKSHRSFHTNGFRLRTDASR